MESQGFSSFMSLMTALSGGMWVSVKVFFLTLLFSLPGGLLIAFGRMSKLKVISVPVNIFMLIIRGTPLMLQIIFVYFAPAHLSQIFGQRFHFDRFIAVIIAFAVVKSNKSNTKLELNKLVDYLGGKDNILETEAEMSRFKVTLKDVTIVDKEAIQKLGAKGIVEIDNQLKIILGSESKQLKKYIDELK